MTVNLTQMSIMELKFCAVKLSGSRVKACAILLASKFKWLLGETFVWGKPSGGALEGDVKYSNKHD